MVPPDPGQPHNGQPRCPAPQHIPLRAAHSLHGQVSSPSPQPRLLLSFFPFWLFFFLYKSRPLITGVWQKKEGEGEKG